MRRELDDPAIGQKLVRVIDALRRGDDVERAAAEAGLDADHARRFLEKLKDYVAGQLSDVTPPRKTKKSGRVGRLTALSDGASRGNPGQAACAVIISDDQGEELLRRTKRLGVVTNNVAEYEGVLLALELAGTLGASDVVLKLDSELVVKQLSGEYKVKHPSMKPLHAKARALMDGFERVKVRHVPRSEMAVVDKLANEALDGKR